MLIRCLPECLSFVFFVAITSFDAISADMEFNLGVGYRDHTASGNTVEEIMLSEVVSRSLNLSSPDKKVNIKRYLNPSYPTLKIYSYNKLNDGRYIVYAWIEDTEDVLKQAGIQFQKSESDLYRDIGAPAVILLVDTQRETAMPLHFNGSAIFPNIQLFAGGRYSSGSADVYACLQAYPTMLADINRDGVEDLIFFGGEGALYLPNDEVTARTDAYFFLGPDYAAASKKILIHDEKFNFYFQGGTHHVTRDSIGSLLDGEGYEDRFEYGNKNNLRPGYRVFSKIYVGEFEGPNKHALLVWRRSYISAKKNSQKGFLLSEETFELVSFTDAGVVPTKLNQPDGNRLVQEQNITWQTGFPMSTFCGDKGSSDQIILDYGYEELQILDSVVVE